MLVRHRPAARLAAQPYSWPGNGGAGQYNNDNLGLWRCIAFHSRALPHWSTQAARELAKSNLNLRTTLLNVPKTSLDKLDKVERHFNQGTQLSDWLGIRVYEPQFVQENGEIM